MKELAKKIHKVNVENGFYDSDRNIGEMLALIHSEVSEALESDRMGRYVEPGALSHMDKLSFDEDPEWWAIQFKVNVKDTFEDEIADAVIRLLDLCAYKGIDIDKHVELKLKYNSTRANKHGKKY